MFTAKQQGLIPTKQTKFSAGYDIRAAEEVIALPHEVVAVPTGVWIDQTSEEWRALAEHFFIDVRIRSSLALQGWFLANGAGVIDMDYPDEIKVLLYNTSTEVRKLNKFTRIGQLILTEHIGNVLLKGTEVKDEKRFGGFGSTGET